MASQRPRTNLRRNQGLIRETRKYLFAIGSFVFLGSGAVAVRVLQSGRELGGWETSRRGVRSAEGLGGRLGGLAAGPGEAMADRRWPAGSTVGEK